MNLNIKLWQLRTDRGLSQKELAEKLGVSPAHITKMEKGDNLPSLQLLEKMASVYGIHMKDFFDIEDVKEIEPGTKIGIDTNKRSTISDEEIKKAVEFVKDLKKGKFDVKKLDDIHL